MGFTAAEININPVQKARLPESTGKKQSGLDYRSGPAMGNSNTNDAKVTVIGSICGPNCLRLHNTADKELLSEL